MSYSLHPPVLSKCLKMLAAERIWVLPKIGNFRVNKNANRILPPSVNANLSKHFVNVLQGSVSVN